MVAIAVVGHRLGVAEAPGEQPAVHRERSDPRDPEGGVRQCVGAWAASRFSEGAGVGAAPELGAGSWEAG